MRLYSTICIVGCIFHELCHAIMGLLMYPFGSRIVGVKIVAGFNKKNSLIFEGFVFTSHKLKIPSLIESIAPLLLYSTLVLMLLINKSWFLPFVMLFWQSMLPSKIDIKNIKAALGFSQPLIVDSEELVNNLNSSINNKIIYKESNILP